MKQYILNTILNLSARLNEDYERATVVGNEGEPLYICLYTPTGHNRVILISVTWDQLSEDGIQEINELLSSKNILSDGTILENSVIRNGEVFDKEGNKVESDDSHNILDTLVISVMTIVEILEQTGTLITEIRLLSNGEDKDVITFKIDNSKHFVSELSINKYQRDQFRELLTEKFKSSKKDIAILL